MSLITIDDTTVYLKQDHYFNKVKGQLSKDFGAEDFDIALNSLIADDAVRLNEIVAKYLTSLEKQNTETFFQILYRIDIPEVNFKAQILHDGLDILALSELVIKRELIKILLREQYS
jgi:hypothetical protein